MSDNIQPKVNTASQLVCAWSSPAATVMWLVGFLALAGFVPPLSPDADALTIAAYYKENNLGVLAGLWFTMMGAALIGPFMVAISIQLKRIEGTICPMTYGNLGLGMLMILLFVVPCFLLGTAAFRPDRDPQLIMLMNDAGWLPFVGGFHCTFIQVLMIAFCILKDKEQKILPRWLGYFNVWIAILLLPSALVLFIKTGPFAWDGEMAFWLVLTIFCGWFLIMFWEIRKAILRQAAGTTL